MRPVGKSTFEVSPGPLDRIIRGNWVGRVREMVEANIQWQHVVSGQGQVILINGEPGIGKTRIVRELGAKARLTGVIVLSGVCYTEGGTETHP